MANFWENFYIRFLIVDIKFRFTCNTIMTQITTTYIRKVITNKTWKLSGVNFWPNPTSLMMFTQYCQIWNFFLTQPLYYFCCEGLRKIMKLQKVSKYRSLKGTVVNYILVFVFKENHLQNVLGNLKKSNKVRQ